MGMRTRQWTVTFEVWEAIEKGSLRRVESASLRQMWLWCSVDRSYINDRILCSDAHISEIVSVSMWLLQEKVLKPFNLMACGVGKWYHVEFHNNHTSTTFNSSKLIKKRGQNALTMQNVQKSEQLSSGNAYDYNLASTRRSKAGGKRRQHGDEKESSGVVMKNGK